MSRDESLPLPDYESTDASPRFVATIGGVLVLGVAISLVVGALIYLHRYRPTTASTATRLEYSFRHGPEEETSIARDWKEQDRLVHEHLYEYGWGDRPAGIVHIPIERAMDLIAAEAAAKPKGNHP